MKKILIMSLLVTFFAHGYNSLLPNTSEQALSVQLSNRIVQVAGYTESMPTNSTTTAEGTTTVVNEYVVTNGGFEDYYRITTISINNNEIFKSKEVAGRFAENHNQIIYFSSETNANQAERMTMYISSIITKGTDQFRLYFVLSEINRERQPTDLYIVSVADGSVLTAHNVNFPNNIPTSGTHAIPFTTTNGEQGEVVFNADTKKFSIAATSP